MTMDMETQIRKYRNDINISGKAFIAFGAWSVIKVYMTSFISKDAFMEFFGSVDINSVDIDMDMVDIFFITGIIAFLIISIIAMCIHLYIGRRAIQFAKGEIKSKVFLFWAIIFEVVQILGLPTYIAENIETKFALVDVATLIVEATVAFILFDMVYKSFKLSKMVD